MLLILFIFAPVFLNAQIYSRIGINELDSLLNRQGDKVYVVNFWATWCGPCVSELPYFEKVAGEYPVSKVDFALVSLDFPSQADKRLKEFIPKHRISLPVFLMTEVDYDLWIPLVDRSWQGNLPATLIFSRKARIFIPEALNEEELRAQIQNILTKTQLK